ncbi:methyltransferase domain-containing protein [bacterium]|jgi:pseudaminic acid biosynthesis-associated methylase|nr:methyltransferase domain-containing protein [bacterium]
MNNDKRKKNHEKFWKGEFGNDYIGRNKLDSIASNTVLFSEIFRKINSINSVLELGCNVGNNLKAINSIIPNAKLYGVEINSKAVEILKSSSKVNVEECPILDYSTSIKFDLVLIKAVLIHIDPDDLSAVYKKIYDCSDKYIVIAEYYSPTPTSVLYRGNKDRLYKRDFAGEFMQLYSNVSLVDYGFKYHKDNMFPQDDISWFLLEKK